MIAWGRGRMQNASSFTAMGRYGGTEIYFVEMGIQIKLLLAFGIGEPSFFVARKNEEIKKLFRYFSNDKAGVDK